MFARLFGETAAKGIIPKIAKQKLDTFLPYAGPIGFNATSVAINVKNTLKAQQKRLSTSPVSACTKPSFKR